MADPFGPPAPRAPFAQVFRIEGTLPLSDDCDLPRLLRHILAILHGLWCTVRLEEAGRIIVDGRSEGHGSVLAFVDAWRVRLECRSGACTLGYGFSTLGGLQLCTGLSVVAAGLAWFTLESWG